MTAALALSMWSAGAGEEVLYQPPLPAPAVINADPFAELLQTYPSEIIKTGPSCSVVKIQLPPGVNPDDIPF
ncbi:MAG: hypothetical protein LUC93_05510 [Planctomycetaceae bacterium]|nr:hypothetical protein [Planctomycetaceae bacterium]